MILRRQLLKGVAATSLVSLIGCATDASGPVAQADSSDAASGESLPYKTIEHIWIPMSDGTRLSARLWLPNSSEQTPVPAVTEMIPYRKRDMYRAADDIWGAVLASNGFAFARIDTRGSGESEGLLKDEYTEQELDDAVEVIAWLAKQDWCSGAVGMRGISWGGINTLQVATKQPPELKSIITMASTDSRFTDDAHYHGGALGRANLQWGISFKSVLASPPDPAIAGPDWQARWLKRLDAAPAIISDWMTHQTFDDYWQRGSAALNYDDITVPALISGGWQDTYANRAVPLLEGLGADTWAVIGPWGHTYPGFAAPQGLDWAQIELRWWRHWLTNQDEGVAADPRLNIFMPDKTARETLPEPTPGHWLASTAKQSEPLSIGREVMTLIPHEGQLLTRPMIPASSSPSIVLAGDRVVGLTHTDWLDRLPIEQSKDDQNSVIFDSEILDADVSMFGEGMLSLTIQSPGNHHIAARLCEVTPDGQSWRVTYAIQNLAQLEGPQNGELLKLNLPLRYMAHRFKAGSRVRLSLSQSLWPMVWPSPETGDLSVKVDQLDLPLLDRKAMVQASTLPLARLPATPPADYEAAEPDETGRYVVEYRHPTSTTEIADTQTTLTRERYERSEIVAGDPNSSIWLMETSTAWDREGWHCAMKVECTIRSTASEFYVTETVTAFSDDQEIFTRTHERTIPRKWV
tara:strand:+ start:18489 stop:20561 length:2073 start_codon:yes stop_codon:yes gene_type:complete